MMAWIVQSSLRFRPLVVGIAVATLIFGIAQLGSMPRDVVPEFTPPYVEIQTEALGLSAEEVEQLITVPLEADLLDGVPWLDVIRSQSVPGPVVDRRGLRAGHRPPARAPDGRRSG